jgi:hypothetical protein
MFDKEVKKCFICAMTATHRFKDCVSVHCECNCLQEIRGEVPLAFCDYPKWFRVIPRKIMKRTIKTRKEI